MELVEHGSPRGSWFASLWDFASFLFFIVDRVYEYDKTELALLLQIVGCNIHMSYFFDCRKLAATILLIMSGRFSRTIYVGNLPSDIREREVEDLF